MNQRDENKHWSQQVTDNSRALELEKGVFTFDDQKRIAQSLKRSAERSKNKKGIRIIWLVCEIERWPASSTHNGLTG